MSSFRRVQFHCQGEVILQLAVVVAKLVNGYTLFYFGYFNLQGVAISSPISIHFVLSTPLLTAQGEVSRKIATTCLEPLS